MPNQHQNKHHPRGRHSARRSYQAIRHNRLWGGGPAGERAQVVSRLLAASQALPAQPDAAILLLDGALSDLLDLWAHRERLPERRGAAALAALDAHAPAIAARLRLALQAYNPEARLAHCWALLDALTPPPDPTRQARHAADPTTCAV